MAMQLWEAATLGVVQGLTEFLPISSTAHLVFTRTLMGHENPDDAFTIVVQLGTIFAVMSYFRLEIVHYIRAVVHDFLTFHLGSSPDSRMAWRIALGTIPVVVVGATCKKFLKDHFYNIPTMAAVAIVFALLMSAAELWVRVRHAKGKPDIEEERITWKEALLVGLWQVLALMPGASRSGTTITGGLFSGLSRGAAARFSFLLSLPAVFGAGMKELYDEYKLSRGDHPEGLFTSHDELTALIVGLVVSGIVGYWAIVWLISFLKRYSTAIFTAYRLVLGVTILVAWGTGVWQLPDKDKNTERHAPIENTAKN